MIEVRRTDKPKIHKANVIIRLDTIKKYLAQYYAAALFNQMISTIRYVLRKNFFTTWPGFTTRLLSKHLQDSKAVSKGHMDQEKQISNQHLQLILIHLRKMYIMCMLKIMSRQETYCVP